MKKGLSLLLFPALLILLAGCQSTDTAEAPAAEAAAAGAVSETVWISSRGVEIPAEFVFPASGSENGTPLVIMAHGHGGNRDEAGGFTALAERLADAGIASIRMDFPGCGESREAFTENYLSNMLADIEACEAWAVAGGGFDTGRIALFGYSMGGRLMLMHSASGSYKALALWAPAGNDGAESLYAFLGGRENYLSLKEEAGEKGFAVFTTPWGQVQNLAAEWFEEMESSRPQEAVRRFEGPVLVLHGDEDTIITQDICDAVMESAEASSDVQERLIKGADHGLGFYSGQTEMAAQVVELTADFLINNL